MVITIRWCIFEIIVGFQYRPNAFCVRFLSLRSIKASPQKMTATIDQEMSRLGGKLLQCRIQLLVVDSLGKAKKSLRAKFLDRFDAPDANRNLWREVPSR